MPSSENSNFEQLTQTLSGINESEIKDSGGAETAKELLDKISSEASKRNETPTHNEIMEVFKLGSEKTKIDVSRACIEKGLREALGNDQKIEGLDQATQIPEDDMVTFMRDRFLNPKANNQPEVFVKQIMKEEGLFHKKRVVSDEALVVVVLNNSKDWKEKTVAMGLVKMNKGVPDLSKGIFTVVSGETYMNNVSGYAGKKAVTYEHIDETEQIGKKKRGGGIVPDMQRAATKFARGEVSQEEYLKRFRRENGKTLEHHWEQWDKEIVNDLRHGKSERIKGETINRLEGRYAQLLQEANEKTNKIINETHKLLETHQTEVDKFIMDPRNFVYLEGLTYQEDPLIVELYERTLMRDFHLTKEDIEQIKKYGTAWIDMKRKKGNQNNGSAGQNSGSSQTIYTTPNHYRRRP